MNSNALHSRWSNPALIVGFNLGIGYVFNGYFGLPNIGHSLITTILFEILLAIAALTIVVGFVAIARRENSQVDRIICSVSIGLVILFAIFDPLLNMNYSPTNCTIGIIGFGLGCLAAAEASQRGMSTVGIGCTLFWLAVAWVIWANYDLLQFLRGKWGVGIFGGWKS